MKKQPFFLYLQAFHGFSLHEFLKCAHQFVKFLFTAPGNVLADAGPDVVRKQNFGETVQCGTGRRSLGNNVDTVGILVQHPLEAADLSIDAGKPVGQVFLLWKKILMHF